MIDRVHWINKEKLVKFILDCQVLSEVNQLLDLPYHHSKNSGEIEVLTPMCSVDFCNPRMSKMEEFQTDQMMRLMFTILTLV